MIKLKPLNREAIPHAIERAERYRLLNEPRVAESICHDVLGVEPDHQQALVILLLAITDQFGSGEGRQPKDALDLIPRLRDAYAHRYYTGLIYERQARARLLHTAPDAKYMAYDLLRTALSWFEKAETDHPPGNEEAVLRWNSCVRLIQEYSLQPQRPDAFQPISNE